jgi:hypothetical protein
MVPLLAIMLSSACAAEGEDPTQPQPSDSATDSTARPDTRVTDSFAAETTVTDGPLPDTKVETSPPPPIEDTSFLDDYGVPIPGSHVEKLIGPEGGELAGGPATLLDKVKLVVPKGALTTTVLFALDYGGSGIAVPTGTSASPFVRVGPDGVAFAIPARMTLPWKSAVMSPPLAMLARIGTAWGSLHDPNADASTITGSMRRTSGVAAVLLELTGSSPSITSRGTGSTVFIEGKNFGLAQVYRYDGDGGVLTSFVTYGGVVSETVGWSDNSIAIKVPAGADGGAIQVATPGGTALAP